MGSTLSEKRISSLAPSALVWMTKTTRRRRFTAYFAAIGKSRAAATVTSWLLGVVMLGAAVDLSMTSILARPSLVSPSHFNLGTLSGQNNFSQAVLTHGVQARVGLYPAGILLGLGVLYVWSQWATRPRSVIPRTVLREEVPTDGTVEQPPSG